MSIIVLADHENEQIALEAVRAGAQDYLVKTKLPGAALLRILNYALERQKFNNERELSLRQVAAAGTNLAKILDSSADGMLVIGADGIVRFANMAARGLFQCHDKPIVGAPLTVPALLEENTEVDQRRLLGRRDR
jgi:PAS domain-containing protein